jgi:hypothetical protein
VQKNIIGITKKIKMEKLDKDIKTKKICHRCKKDQDILCFNKDSKSKDGFKASCKECISLYSKKYTFKNKIKLKEQIKQWKEQNKEYVDLYMLDYQKKNKNKIYKRSTEYHKIRYNNDPIFKLRRLLRDRIYKVISNKKVTSKTKELLGCSFELLKQHLESLFKHGMTWSNHGIFWEIDHIKPVSSFDLTDIEQQKQCFHYTNLQPLTKKDNRTKSNKL